MKLKQYPYMIKVHKIHVDFQLGLKQQCCGEDSNMAHQLDNYSPHLFPLFNLSKKSKSGS